MDQQRASSRLSLFPDDSGLVHGPYPQPRYPQPLRHCSIVSRGKSREMRERRRRGRNDVMWARELHLGRATTFLIAESFTSRHYASRETPTRTHVIVMSTFVASLPPDRRKKKRMPHALRAAFSFLRLAPFRRLIIHRRHGKNLYRA